MSEKYSFIVVKYPQVDEVEKLAEKPEVVEAVPDEIQVTE